MTPLRAALLLTSALLQAAPLGAAHGLPRAQDDGLTVAWYDLRVLAAGEVPTMDGVHMDFPIRTSRIDLLVPDVYDVPLPGGRERLGGRLRGRTRARDLGGPLGGGGAARRVRRPGEVDRQRGSAPGGCAHPGLPGRPRRRRRARGGGADPRRASPRRPRSRPGPRPHGPADGQPSATCRSCRRRSPWAAAPAWARPRAPRSWWTTTWRWPRE